jgi:hypothetical protein
VTVKLYRLLLCTLALATVPCAWGEDLPPPGEAPPPVTEPAPGDPPPTLEGETLAPEVTIKQEGERTIEEHRIDGRLYMVKIQPKGAPAYYFFDTDGDGVVDMRGDDPADFPLNQWMLLRW